MLQSTSNLALFNMKSYFIIFVFIIKYLYANFISLTYFSFKFIFMFKIFIITKLLHLILLKYSF